MRVLITGATGSIGKELVPLLLKNNDIIKILTINRDLKKAEILFQDIKVINKTVDDLEKNISSFNPDVVIHLAAYITSSNEFEEIDKLIDSNISFGVKILDSLKTTNVKYFLNIGTFAEYRLGVDHVNNAYLYSATKTAFKSILDYYSELLDFNYFHLIPYTVYGNRSEQKKVIDYIVDSINSNVPIMMTNGEQILDFIHVKDVANYILNFLSLLNNMCKYNKYNFYIGTGKGTSIRLLAHLIENIYQKPTNIIWGAKPYRPMDVMYAVAPIQMNIEVLKWQPLINLDVGLQMYKDSIVFLQSKTCGIKSSI